MLLWTLFALVAFVTRVLGQDNATTSNPSRYVQAPIYRDGEANNPLQGYYWIKLGFGPYTVGVIVDSGWIALVSTDDREWRSLGCR